MNNIEEKAIKINLLLKNNKTFREFEKIKNALNENNVLINLKKEIVLSKKKYFETKDNVYKNQYLEIEKEYQEYYLVKQYEALRSEIEEILVSISLILSQKTL